MTRDSRRPSSARRARPRRAAFAVAGVACAATLVGLAGAPAQASEPPQRVRFDCTSADGHFTWTAPPGVSSFDVKVVGGAGGSLPGKTGRGGHGAIVEGTLFVPGALVEGVIGCSGDHRNPNGFDGGPGGHAAGDADDGAAGGSGTQLSAENESVYDPGVLVTRAQLWAGGGGGGGGRGSGFGINAGGDGGDAGRIRVGQRGAAGRPGDDGTPGGGAGGGSATLGDATCWAPINLRFGQPGQDADGAGGGGGGGGGGFERGGCGGGAGSAVSEFGRVVVGSGGGGQAGGSTGSGMGTYLRHASFDTGNRGDGYVLITYRQG